MNDAPIPMAVWSAMDRLARQVPLIDASLQALVRQARGLRECHGALIAAGGKDPPQALRLYLLEVDALAPTLCAWLDEIEGQRPPTNPPPLEDISARAARNFSRHPHMRKQAREHRC